MARVAVVGGGVLGLAVARSLLGRGDDVTVFEKAHQFGGLASGWHIGDIGWDRHHHTLLSTDSWTRELIEWVGLEPEIRWRRARTGFFTSAQDGLRSASDLRDLVRFSSLNWIDTARIAATILAMSRISDGALLENKTMGEWLRRRSGGRAFDRFWVPLLRANLGPVWTETSAAYLWAMLRRVTTSRRTGTSDHGIGHVPGGHARMFDLVTQKLLDQGVKFLGGTRVIAVQACGYDHVVVTENGSETFDRVVVTLAAPLAARICLDLTDDERDRLRRVRYQGVITASLLLPERLAEFYRTHVADPLTPFATVVEATAVADPAEFGGRHLVYLSRFVASDDPILEAGDDEILRSFMGQIERMYPGSGVERTAEVVRVSRSRHAFPIPTLGYSRSMPTSHTSVPRLQVLSSANALSPATDINATLELVGQLS